MTGTCQAGDSTSARILETLNRIVAPRIASDSMIRSKLGLNAVTPAQIELITNNSVCTRAAYALDALRDEKSTSYSVYVFSLGTSYAVMDRDARGSGYAVAWIFDSAWQFVAAQAVF
jgi:hypothetical protein